MSFNVSNEIKEQLLTERLQALNLEGYQNELNLKAAEALGNQEVIDQATANIVVIKSAIEVHTSELESL
ncbi:MAG: hypothetical protein EBS85_03800 [Micrococcales bacterium]|nr:hypothetical protein [Actinomycetota bacterium]NCA07835.1 hypothetical protein [Micrococcales bacterium]